MVPNFILAGAMKSGTTFLHNLLENHPQIFIINRDMDHAYFDDDRIYKRGKEWYCNLFKSAISDSKIGEIIGQTSADCNYNPGSVRRILEYNPDMKLIFVLRHPVDRAYSLYWHQYRMGREYKSFEYSIKIEPQRVSKSYYNFKNYSYLGRSKYNTQFKEILELVPAENLLILDFEFLIKRTKESVNEVLEFLEVEKINEVEELNYSKLPRNSASIPSSHIVVIVSAYLQKIGLVSFGRRLVYLFGKEERPPKIDVNTRMKLENELKDDVIFYEKIKDDFRNRIDNK